MISANGTKTPTSAAVEEEEAILGSIFLGGVGTLEKVRPILSPGQFGIDLHASVFGAMLDLDQEGLPCNDLLLLKQKLGDKWDGATIGRLATCVPTTHNAEFWSREVLKRWTAQQTAIIAETALRQTAHGVEPTSVIRGVLRDLNSLIDQSADARAFSPVGVAKLAADHPTLHAIIVEGLIRLAEVVNVIAASKQGKSWLTYGLSICVAMGWKWLGRFWCDSHGGRVLIIDFELHESLLASRIKTVAEAMGITIDDLDDRLHVVSLRGRQLDVFSLGRILDAIPHGRYSMLILDAVYRSYPANFNENSNADVTAYYNQLDAIAKRLGCAIVCIHHSSKGNQGEKSVTDVGSGAGAQSRAADAHLILRPHEMPDCAVLDAALRSFPPLEPVTLRWEFPTWEVDDSLDPADLKGRKTKSEERLAARDNEGKSTILSLLADGPRTKSWITKNGGPSPGRTERLLSMLIAEGLVTTFEGEASGNECTFYQQNERETEGGVRVRGWG